LELIAKNKKLVLNRKDHHGLGHGHENDKFVVSFERVGGGRTGSGVYLETIRGGCWNHGLISHNSSVLGYSQAMVGLGMIPRPGRVGNEQGLG